MKKYVVVDTIKNGDDFTKFFNTENEALNEAENAWLHLTKKEQEKREMFFVGYCDDYNEEEGYSEGGNFYLIKDYKTIKEIIICGECFTDLEEAKEYVKVEDPEEDDFLGDNWEEYLAQLEGYNKEIDDTETLEDLAIVLNRYTDTFSNGSEAIIKEISLL